MDSLVSQLLNLENSELALYLRHDLRGLCASLASALEANPSDPGRVLCQHLIAHLEQLLKESSPALGQPLSSSNSYNLEQGESESSVSDSSIHDRLRLRCLSDTFSNDETICSFLGRLSFYSTQDADLWNEVQMLLFRLSEPLVKYWQQKALDLAVAVGAEPNAAEVIKLPFTRKDFDNSAITGYPGLKGTIITKGLSLSDEASFEEELNVKDVSSELKFLAEVVSICLHFIDTDQHLQHCLKSLYQFGVTRMNSKQRLQYRKTLIVRFLRVKESENDPVKALKARLDLDEAIHSLIYLPLVESNSWWGKLQQAARKSLDPAVERVRQTGCDAGHQWLLGVRDNIIQYTKDDVPYPNDSDNFPSSRGTPGKVMTCLRVYAWIGEEKFLGRVIFCPR